MKNFAGIAGTKFGSEAVMKSEAAFQNFETPPLRPEVPLLRPEVCPLQKKSQEKRVLSCRDIVAPVSFQCVPYSQASGWCTFTEKAPVPTGAGALVYES